MLNRLKVVLFIGLFTISSIITISAGKVSNFNWTVPAANMTAETGMKTTSERSKIGVSANLNKNGKVADKVIFWTTWFSNDTRKSENIIVQEGGVTKHSYNQNGDYHDPGDEIRINFKNGNFGINTDYTITGTVDYH